MKKHTLGDAPIEPKHSEQMNAFAAALDELFNGDKRGNDREVGFCLMIFPFDGFDGRANYVSNAKREDVIKLLEEQLARFKRQAQEKP